MKILFLNPQWLDAPLIRTLRNLGVATLVCAEAREAELVLKLHAGGLTLFVGHEEFGMRLSDLIKSTPRFAHIPVILTTAKWSDVQCADHQATPKGANAYVRTPIADADFISIIDQILGTELAQGRALNIPEDLHEVPNTLPIAASEEKTSLSIAGITLAAAPLDLAQETNHPRAPENDGISVNDGISMHVGASTALEVEDAAALYGAPTPAATIPTSDADNLRLEFALEEPSMDLGGLLAGSPPEVIEEGGTQEFRIDTGESPEGSIASPILATPIEPDEAGTRIAIHGSLEAESDDAFDSPLIMGTMASPAAENFEQPTRVVLSPMPSQSRPAAQAPQTSSISRAPSEELDADALSTMPYLGKSSVFATNPNPLNYREPMDDAVVPGGAANSPDAETLKKYLYLREQDVTALSAQLRQARERVNELEQHLRHEKSITSEFAHLAQEQDRRIHDFDKEKAVAVESAQKEIDDLKFEMKRRHEKIRVMELQVKEATDATERLKERVRNDIRKIRTREKELENRLEIMKKDSEALLGAREHKIIDLKRKLDLIEFNTDLLQDQLDKERRITSALREKLAKAAQIVRVAGGLLTPEEEALLATGVNPHSLKEEDDRTPAA